MVSHSTALGCGLEFLLALVIRNLWQVECSVCVVMCGVAYI